jgi:hypothetical protein
MESRNSIQSRQWEFMYKTIKLLSLLLITSASLSAQEASLVLNFKNTFGSDLISFDQDYTNVHGENLRFTLLNYFISNISLTKTDGSVYSVPQDSSYFLIKHTEPESQTIELKVPKGKYKLVSFMIGVDSLRSTKGIEQRQGMLDVGGHARGMYWAWHSGYIFFKMEGKSKSLPDSTNGFYYHIGGYGGFDKPLTNNIRYKILDLTTVKVTDKKTPIITVTVDASKVFDALTPLKVTQNRSVMGGPLSIKIADNYVESFSLKEITYLKR